MNEHDLIAIISDEDKDIYIEKYNKILISRNYRKIYNILRENECFFDSDLDNYFSKNLENKSKLVLDKDGYYLNFINLKFPRNVNNCFVYRKYIIKLKEMLRKLFTIGFNIVYKINIVKFNNYDSCFSNFVTQNVITNDTNAEKKMFIIDALEITPYNVFDEQSTFYWNAIQTPIIVNFDTRYNLII